VRVRLPNVPVNVAARQLRHNHVEQGQRDVVSALGQKLHGSLALFGLHRGVAGLLQDADRHVAHDPARKKSPSAD